VLTPLLTPAKAGVHGSLECDPAMRLGARFRGHDGLGVRRKLEAYRRGGVE
jgi:hypothetical protein